MARIDTPKGEEYSIQYKATGTESPVTASVYTITEIPPSASETYRVETLDLWGEDGFPSGLSLPGVPLLVPEVGTVMLVMLGLLGLAICGKKR